MNMRLIARLSFTAALAVGITACAPPEENDGGPTPDGGVVQEDAGPQPDVAPPGEDCGDGVINAGEQCDDGAGNGDGPNQCRENCTRPVCGDGILDDGPDYGEACDDGNTLPGDGCNPNCVIEVPVAVEVALQGAVKNREYLNVNPQAGVVVRVTNAQCGEAAIPCVSEPSAADTGNYSLPGLPVNSAIQISTNYPGDTYGPNNSPVPNSFVTRQNYQTYDQETQTIDPSILRYNAAAQLSVDCGVYASLDVAYGNTDWSIYSVIFGKLEDANGNGVAGINKNRLQVRQGAELNNSVTRGNENYFCWLGPDVGNPQKLAGTQGLTSQAGGYFAIFKVRGDNGTGAGTAYVNPIYDAVGPNFVEKSVNLSAGNIGVVTLTVDDGVPPPVLVSFNDVYNELYGSCIVCHTEGGPGDVQDGGGYYARFDLAAEEVYNNLTGYGVNCAEGPRRVCVDDPDASRLLHKPLDENPPDHPNANYADVNAPGYVMLKAWIEQGAVYQFTPPPPEPTLQAVIEASNNRGCNACHAGSAARGGLSIGECYPPEEFDYAAVGVEVDPAINPNYAQDCTYYHLVEEAVLDDFGGYRVNVANPAQSMLIYNPLCGQNGCLDENHPVQVFPNEDDPSYILMYDWIAAGALNNYNP